MTNQAGSSRVDTVLKMLLIAFISLLAFSSGVYFGKQMSDSDYKLKALESDFNHSTKVAEGTKGHGEHGAQNEDVLVDEEVAALSDKFVSAERDELAEAEAEEAAHGKTEEARKVASADGHEEAAEGEHGTPAGHGAPAAKAPAAVAGKPDLSAAHKAASRVANNAAPTENAKQAPVESPRQPSALPKTVGGAGAVEFTVQVASYPTAAAAKDHAAELVKKGFPAFPVEATVNGRTWYRVSVGSFKSMREATVYRAQLVKQADVQSAIVQKIQR